MAISSLSEDTATSFPLLLSANAGANTKSTYTALTASSAIAASGLIIVPFLGTAIGEGLIDIATGGAGSETDIIANIPCSRPSSGNAQHSATCIPISIASGTRIAARWQSNVGTTTMRLGSYLIAKDTVAFDECTSCVTYGANTTDSGGTSIDPGGSANTKGSYSEITASTSADIKWLVVGVCNQANAGRTSNSAWLVDIATGAGGAESVIISNLTFTSDSTSSCIFPFFLPPIPIEIASGTRIAARAQCNLTDATDRLFDVIILGLNGTATGGGGGGGFSAYVGR